MPSSTSSSRTSLAPTAWFVGTLAVLLLAWELVIRANYNPPVEVGYARIGAPEGELAKRTDPDREWFVFGNCLVLNGLSPELILKDWQAKRPEGRTPVFKNLSRHEYAPQAYLTYLERVNRTPDAVLFNVSSWLNSDNFAAEAKGLEDEDLLGLRDASEPPDDPEPTFQARVENSLAGGLAKGLRMTDKRYHLFDFGMFLGALVTEGDLKASLYQLSIQSWYGLKGQHEDGLGHMAFDVSYAPDWEPGVETMIDKQLPRMRLGNFLTDSYWASLEERIRAHADRGTKVVLLRMPEHPRIHAFNESAYRLTERMKELSDRTGAPMLDFNADAELMKSIKLFDGVHPDRASSGRISRYAAAWIAERHPEWIYSD